MVDLRDIACEFRELCGGDAPGPVRPDPALVTAGWTARFLVEPGRVDELSVLYREAGFEVRACAVEPQDFDERCGTCPSVVCKTFLMLYTKLAK
jgi:hypothetical protein